VDFGSCYLIVRHLEPQRAGQLSRPHSVPEQASGLRFDPTGIAAQLVSEQAAQRHSRVGKRA